MPLRSAIAVRVVEVVVDGQQQPIRPQCAAYLRQRPRQIVDELKGQSGDRKVERFRLQRDRLGLDIRQIDRRELIDPIEQPGAELVARSPDVGRALELPQHGLQPFRRILGDAIKQKCRGLAAQSTITPRPQQGTVEQHRGGIRVRHYHALVCSRLVIDNHMTELLALNRAIQFCELEQPPARR